MELSDDDALSVQALSEVLVERLEASGLGQRAHISVSDLQRSWIPYAECRNRLGFATKAEYDLALLRLLNDQGVVVAGDDELTAAVQKELSSPEPGLSFLESFGSSELELNRGPGEPRLTGPPSRERAEPEVSDAMGKDSEVADEDGEGLDSLEHEEAEELEAEEVEVAEPANCWKCDGLLARGSDLLFCPHCGTDQTVWRCLACGEVLETGWKFCPRCGTDLVEI